MNFITKAGAITEKVGHHPDFHLTSYRNIEVVIYSHLWDGLTENDFILTKEIDEGAPVSYSPKWLK